VLIYLTRWVRLRLRAAIWRQWNSEILKSQLVKLKRGLERLIDSYSEGTIDKEEFMPRLNRTKVRITALEARIHTNSDWTDRQQQLRFLVDHFKNLAVHLGPSLENADCNRRREIIRSLVERIEIARMGMSIAFRGLAFRFRPRISVS
jgi:site-specific DNA recombinase